MTADSESDSSTRWVVAFLLDGDDSGATARDLERRMRRAVVDSSLGRQLIASNVGRLRDLSDAERQDWERVLKLFEEDD